jgi:hypothetical protein
MLAEANENCTLA